MGGGHEGLGRKQGWRICARNRVTFLQANVIQKGCPAAPVEDRWEPSTELLQLLRGSRQSLGLLQESPLRFVLTLKKLLQVKSQEPSFPPLQATVLPDPLGEAWPPVRK